MSHSSDNRIGRRTVLRNAAMTGAGIALARPALAQAKPERLVFLRDAAPWGASLHQEVIPAWEKETGIKIEATLLPGDALNARLKAELNSGSSSIDIVGWIPGWKGWIGPFLADHGALLTEAGGTADSWDDIIASTREMATIQGKQLGVPYRATVFVQHTQPAVLEQAGIAKPPGTFAEFQAAAQAVTAAGGGKRYGVGIVGKQGANIVACWQPFLFSCGGQFYDPKTWQVLINDARGVRALEFFGDLVTKYHAVPPEALTWDTDELIAGGQNDRYGMTVALGPWASQIIDPAQSRTVGKWAWSQTPGADSPEQGRSPIGGWTFSVTKNSRSQLWAFRFLQYATSQKWLQKSMDSGNLPPRNSVLNDPAVLRRYPWAAASAVALKTAVQLPADEIWAVLEARLRVAVSEVISGRRSAKQALDATAEDWTRAIRRAGLVQ